MTRQFTPFICLNCDETIALNTPPKLYCSIGCSQEAELIRYVRRCSKDGRIDRPDVVEAIQIRLAHIMSGGYDKRERKIPPEVRSAVIARDNGCCCMCGSPGMEIDHIEGPSITMENLQLLCDACHNAKTVVNIHYVLPGDAGYEELKKKNAEFWKRTKAKRPVRICDDEENWKKQYYRLMAECRLALNKQINSGRS